MPRLVAASMALRVSTSHTASWNDAATSATSIVTPARCCVSTHRATAVLRPENEKSKRCRSRSRRWVSPRGKSMATLLPLRAALSMCGPPGNGSPSSRATLSKASPAASSIVAPIGSTPTVTSVTSSRLEWPPETSMRQARLRQRTVLELVDRDVGGQVVDAVDRLAEPERERLGAGDSHQQRTGEAGTAGDGDRVDVAQRDAGRLGRPLDRRDHRLEVRTAGHLGHHAAEPGVLLDAAGDRVGQQRVAPDDADPGLVARGLDAEDQGPVSHAPSP